jgi:hypothetical protein
MQVALADFASLRWPVAPTPWPTLKFTLRSGSRRGRLRSPAGPAVLHVMVNRNGQTETYQGGIVVVSCGAAKALAAAPQRLHQRKKVHIRFSGRGSPPTVLDTCRLASTGPRFF